MRPASVCARKFSLRLRLCVMHFPAILNNYNGTTAYICRRFIPTTASLVTYKFSYVELPVSELHKVWMSTRLEINTSAANIIMATLCNRAGHYIFALWFLSFFFFFFYLSFRCLISAAADWMSTILPHIVWP